MSDRLRTAFVASYRPFVEGRIAARGLPPVNEAIVLGESWLDGALSELLILPAAEQSRAPLEIFQEAMRFPTAALVELGETPVGRDPVTTTALPGDLFDLAPASSQDLGPEAWRAHIAWGASKASRMGPLAVLVTRNLMDASRIEPAGTSAGFRVVTVIRLDDMPEGGQVVAFVDLEHPDADQAVRMLAESTGQVIAYGPHVDDIAMVRAQSLGAAEALPRSRFFKDVAGHFPTIV